MTPLQQATWSSLKTKVEIAEGRSLSVIKVGDCGPAVVLIHGYTDTSRSFSLLAPHLNKMKLILPDLRGHGGSFRADDDYSIEAMANDIAALIKIEGLKRPILIGHSLGAIIAIKLAADYPKCFSGLVTIAGSLKPDALPMESEILALSYPLDPKHAFFGTWHNCLHPVDEEFLNFVAKEAAELPAIVWHSILGAIANTDLDTAASFVDVPTLVAQGSDDSLFDNRHHRRLMHTIKSARAVIVDGCGHNPHWEQPQRIAEAIIEFVESELSMPGHYKTRI